MVTVDFGFDLMDPATYWPTAKKIVGSAVGTGTPAEQIIANSIITAALMLSSAVGFLVGIPLAVASLFLLFLGILRLWGPIGKRWPL